MPPIPTQTVRNAAAQRAGLTRVDAKSVDLLTASPQRAEGQAWAPPSEVAICPAGPRIEGKDGRFFILENAQALVDRMNLRIEKLGAHGEVLFDFDHKSEDYDWDSSASGWGIKHEVRDGAIVSKMRWTDGGSADIQSGARRFLSPVFWVDSQNRIVDISSVALLNKANLLLPALNREGDDNGTGTPVALKGSVTMKTLMQRLGLNETASEADAVVALNGMLERAGQPDLKAFVPRADYDVALNRASAAEGKVKAIEDKQVADAVVAKNAAVETEVDAAVTAGKISPATKSFYVKAAQRSEEGLAEFREFVKDAAPVLEQNNITDRAVPKTGEATKSLNAEEQKMARNFGITDEEFVKRRNDAA